MFQHLEYIFQRLKYMFQLLKQNFFHREKTFIALSCNNLSTMFRKSRSYAMKNGGKYIRNILKIMSSWFSFLFHVIVGTSDFDVSFQITINHRLSKYCCISSAVLHTMVSPRIDSSRAFLIFARIAGVIPRSSLIRAIRTDATPRISFRAFFISDVMAPASKVTIIWVILMLLLLP